jgi:DNA-binding transcriptional regulator YiaG
MTVKQFNAALESAGLTQQGFAATIRVNERTVRRWASGEAVVPTPIAMLLNLMLKTGSTAEDLKP